jgi:hypothetical protein
MLSMSEGVVGEGGGLELSEQFEVTGADARLRDSLRLCHPRTPFLAVLCGRDNVTVVHR